MCVCVREIEGVTTNRLSPAATFLHLNPELSRGSLGILAQMLRGACCSVVMASELGYPSPAILTPQASSTSIISLWGYNKGVEEIFLPPPNRTGHIRSVWLDVRVWQTNKSLHSGSTQTRECLFVNDKVTTD